ncbi:MAG: 2-hydroxyacyl-CoA dehydratase family protein [Myxococcota bacterium]|jgi:benzoyl-CoA reductase/2-hydroxyglutaryl-CoA dehydratase subunit BcrC/BadD/HgdB|nr:2-hydroxyacyl-CoA dehydratase family protein [Myxococcota bacterium]
MNESARPRVGFTCSYTPLPLIHAAGFEPYRMLPLRNAPDQAGGILHDNLCPEVKRVLDRRLSGDLPPLAGVIFVNSCDAMRRLGNAWEALELDRNTAMLDVPTVQDAAAGRYLAVRLEELRDRLGDWAGTPVEDDTIRASTALYDRLFDALAALGERVGEGNFAGGRPAYQEWLNRSVCESPETVLAELLVALEDPDLRSVPSPDDVPLLVFGNVLPDPEAAALFEGCGARVVDDDLCSGSRQLTRVGDGVDGSPIDRLAAALMGRPLCARTMRHADGAALAEQVIAGVRAAGARGAVAHVVKFCDPYLVRLPALREGFRDAEVPLLVLEGDCTLRSLGQQRTRIEAFVEMLREAP